MRKETIYNPRYPHTIRVVRITHQDWLSDEQEAEEVIYYGPGRCYTSGGVEGRAVDITTRLISIPVNVSEWSTLHPASGDSVTVTMGEVTETMEVKDFEPDNNRSVLYCKRNGNYDV